MIAFQELRTVPDQARWIAREVERRSAGRLRCRRYRRAKAGLWGLWEGVGVLSRLPVVSTAWLPLGAQSRVALRVTIRRPGGGLLDVYDTHLGVGGEALRVVQAQRILDWIATRPPVPAVLLGDLNARPGSPTIELLSTGLRSAHATVHGHEPTSTAPTPLRVKYTGDGAVLDYIFVNDRVDIRDARIVFDQVHPADPTLLASDHYGLVAIVSVSCSPASPAPPRR